MHSLPPLKALRAFEAAGRLLSFRKAAQELHVTPAAVSHQIKVLEDHLGVQLFRRLTRTIELTEIGRVFLPQVHEGFQRVAQAVNDIRCYRKGGILTVCAAPSFAAKWLMPRLHSFVQAYPEIDIRISTSGGLVDSRRVGGDNGRTDEADVAICFGAGKHPGRRVDKLFSLSFTPLCSPRLMAAGHPLREPADLRHHLLLHDDLPEVSEGWADWAQWLRAAGANGVDAARGPHFSQPILALEAAADGAGVVLGARELAAFDLATGTLAAPFAFNLETGGAYYVVTSEDGVANPNVDLFRQWLVTESAALPGLIGTGG